MQLSLRLDPSARTSLSEQLVQQIRTMIESGRLMPGSRLPGTRTLSDQLGISRNTILHVYESLGAEGYLEFAEGAGTFVSASPPAAGARISCMSRARDVHRMPESVADARRVDEGLDMASAAPEFDFELEGMDPDIFPGNTWRRLMTRRMQSSNFNLTRNDASYGLRRLREALVAFLGATRGMTVHADQIVIVTGIQQALNVVGRLLVRPGTTVVTETPGCSLIAGLYEGYGGKNVPVVADDDGINVAQLPECRDAVVLVTPSRHFPLGGVLSPVRRDALLTWAQRTGSHVVDVDFDSDFRYEGSPPASLQGLDHSGRFIYTGSFAMTIGPGLRIGYMVLPAELVDGAKQAIRLLDYGFPCHGVPWLDQAVLADFMESGGYARHLRVLRRNYLERRDCLIDALRHQFGAVDLRGVASGTHLAWRLPEQFESATTCRERARSAGVAVYTLKRSTNYGAECIVGADSLNDWDRYLMLGFASMRVPGIAEAVGRLARAVR